MVKWIIEYAAGEGISRIVLGNLKGVRESNHKNPKVNFMINNFWSFSWVIERLREKAEE
jgi:IS605 OrfB family transposase